MAFDIEAAIDGLAALMDTIPELQVITVGAPESLGAQVIGWVTVGDPDVIAPRLTSVYDLPVNLIAWFGYSVAGDEGAAERKLADYVTELTRRLIQNRIGTVGGVTRNLNGSVEMMGLPQAAAGASEYATMAGSETRVYPLGVRVTQRETIA